MKTEKKSDTPTTQQIESNQFEMWAVNREFNAKFKEAMKMVEAGKAHEPYYEWEGAHEDKNLTYIRIIDLDGNVIFEERKLPTDKAENAPEPDIEEDL